MNNDDESYVLVEPSFPPKRQTPEYYTWIAMKQRCFNPKNKLYHRYGGRGITIDYDWLTFENFLRDMGPKPSSLYSLDRIDNDKGYSKSNCRWATNEEQQKTINKHTGTSFAHKITICEYCHKKFTSKGRGSPQKYCCHAHRQYAYLQRRPPKPAKPVTNPNIIFDPNDTADY